MSTYIPVTPPLTPAQRRALLTLMNADGWDRRPCRDPQAWDLTPLPRSQDGVSKADRSRAYVDREQEIRNRVRACSMCPALTECAAYANTHPRVTGIIAGRLIGSAT